MNKFNRKIISIVLVILTILAMFMLEKFTDENKSDKVYQKIDLTQKAAFNYQGTGAVQWLIGFPLLLIPMLFFYLPYKFINFEAGIITLIILGVIGIVFHQKLMVFINKQYLKSKYKMISAFDQNN